jgi:hypothetical protein
VPRVKKAQKAIPLPEEAESGICFTVMPFGGWFDKYYDEI